METKGTEGDTQLVIFFLEREEFACCITDVREVLKMVRVTPLPHSREFVEGVINLRGDIIPVIDLRRRFGLPAAARTDQSRIVIVEFDAWKAGLIVDAVRDIIRLPGRQIQEVPGQAAADRTRLILGVGRMGDRLLNILNLCYILSTEDQIALEDIAAAARQLETRGAGSVSG